MALAQWRRSLCNRQADFLATGPEVSRYARRPEPLAYPKSGHLSIPEIYPIHQLKTLLALPPPARRHPPPSQPQTPRAPQ